MKVELSILSLILLVACTAQKYELQCTRNELGILWPNYEDKALYYECLNVGKPILRTCSAGTWFTFVYQMCTPQEDYIKPPPLENLPTEKPPGGGNSTTSAPSSTGSTMTTCPPTTTCAPTTTVAPTTCTTTTAAPTTCTTTTAAPTTTKIAATTTVAPVTTAAPTTTKKAAITKSSRASAEGR